jgi:hypothetical protein
MCVYSINLWNYCKGDTSMIPPQPDKIIPRELFFQTVGFLARVDGFTIFEKVDGMKWAEKLLSESKDASHSNVQSERDKVLDAVELITKTRSWGAMDAFLVELRQSKQEVRA